VHAVQQVTRKFYEMEDVELEVTEIEMQEVDEEVEEEVLEDVEMPVEVSRRIPFANVRLLFYMNLLSLPMTIVC
jgi:histidinol dehydrogenase